MFSFFIPHSEAPENYRDEVMNRWHEFVNAAKGYAKIKEILTYLHYNNYSGFLSLEPHLGIFDGLENLELDKKHKEVAKSGEVLFAIATEALNYILSEITEGDVNS